MNGPMSMPNGDPDGVPFPSPMMTVESDWIDFNGHMNMAYYNVLFDRGVDAAFGALGLGAGYAVGGFTTFAAEIHVCYVRELHEGDPVQVTLQILGHDAKRIHFYEELRHADGWLSATAEAISLHIDRSGPRVAPFPAEVLARIARMQEAHAVLPRPERAGRSIGIPRRG